MGAIALNGVRVVTDSTREMKHQLSIKQQAANLLAR